MIYELKNFNESADKRSTDLRMDIMKNYLKIPLLAILLSLIAYSGQDSKKVAIVKLVRGNATFLSPDGEQGKITKGIWVKEGAVIKTEARSFVRLNFIDKSSMNVGPKSELKIEKFSKSEAGVINVLTGKIRSKVTKDYLKMDKDKSKLFVKSRNAVMGVRGTDFLFSANKKSGTSTAILFEGAIVFNKLEKGANSNDLESIVSKGRKIAPGQVSVASRNIKKPTVPAKLNKKQFESLNKNKDFKVSKVKKGKKVKSVVPPGLSGEVVSAESKSLKEKIKKVIKVDVASKDSTDKPSAPTQDSKGFVKGDDVKPADGVVVHVDSGLVIPPGSDSVYDSNTGEWVSNTNGDISATGEYVPPEGFAVDDGGNLLKVDETGKAKEIVVVDIKPVDQMEPIELAKTVEYKAPKQENDINVDGGPAPAGEKENIDEGVKQDDGAQLNVSEPEVLPPPPQPENQVQRPNTFNNNTGLPLSGTATAPPPSGRTRVIIKPNKENSR